MRRAWITMLAAVAVAATMVAAGGRETTTPAQAAPKAAAKHAGHKHAGRKVVRRATTKSHARKGGRKTASLKPSTPALPPAKELFGAVKTAAPLAARSIGFYARGCLAGAKALPVNGPTWQAMRLSRNRRWGHPDLIALVEKLAADAKAKDGWPGLLVGDISQPRGGPMLTGHASHQVGLDADIWLTPMPDRRLTTTEREALSATSMLGPDKLSVDPKVFTSKTAHLILRAAGYPQVERVLVNPAIKKALCEDKTLPRAHFNKVRPYWGHHYHMHIRISCPKGSTNCKAQPPPPGDDGCGKELTNWMALMKRRLAPAPAPKVAVPKVKPKPRPPARQVTLADLPPECKAVLEAGNAVQQASPADLPPVKTPVAAKR